MSTPNLPPLPEPFLYYSTAVPEDTPVFTGEQMHTYARAASAASAAEPLPEGWRAVLVNAEFDNLMYWLDRCERKGHLENCVDLIEPWAKFEYLEHTAPNPVSAEPVGPGSLPHLKLMMEHSAWNGMLQLDDALANIDDFAALPATTPPTQQPAPAPAQAPPLLSDDELDAIDMDAQAKANQNPEGTPYHWRKAYLRAFSAALAARAAQPMSDDQVWHNDALMSANGIAGFKMDALMRIVRAVEAHHFGAHGITQPQQEPTHD